MKNSPLDHLARLSAQLVLCAKGVCDQAQPVGVVMGILLGVDTALEKADKKALFGPLLGSALKTVLPNNEVKIKVADLLKEPISLVDKNYQEVKELNDMIDKISNWSSTDNEAKQSANEIISELNKRKGDINKHNNELQSEINRLLKSNPFVLRNRYNSILEPYFYDIYSWWLNFIWSQIKCIMISKKKLN